MLGIEAFLTEGFIFFQLLCNLLLNQHTSEVDLVLLPIVVHHFRELSWIVHVFMH